LPDEASWTADFLETVDGLFDCFNSRNLFDTKSLHRPLTTDSSHWLHLDECERQLKTLKVVGCKVAVPCISGWLLDINALRILWSNLQAESTNDMQVRFLLTSRLNQDSLENFFALIRGRGGYRDNPDPVHFQSAFKQMAMKSIFVPAPTANCQQDCAEFLLQVDDFALIPTERKTSACVQSLKCEVVKVDSDLHDVCLHLVNNDAEQNTLMYVTGYVCKRVLDRHNCTHCQASMIRDSTTLLRVNDIFSTHKAYNTARGNFGGLKAPSEFMYNLISSCEQTFTSLFDSVKHVCGVKRQLMEAIVGTLSTDDEAPCMTSQKRAADIYFSTRLHYKLKFLKKDNNMQAATNTRKNRKALKVMHR